MASTMRDARQQVRDQIKSRGRRKYYVCMGYAAKGGFAFHLDGTPNTFHLIWMEADQNIVEYEIPQYRIVGQNEEGPQGTVPDAICRLRSGKIQWREIKTEEEAALLKQAHTGQVLAQTSSATTYGAEWLLVTTRDLDRNEMLIKNWRVGLSYMWTALGFDLRPFMQDIRHLVQSDKARSLRQIVDGCPASHQSLLIAAVFRLAQTGEVTTDLADKKFGWNTTVRAS